MEPKVSIQLITPEQAEIWLETASVHNRRERPGVVARFVDILERDEWRLTNDAISRTNGKIPMLLNGQHRLRAIVRSGIPARCLVIEGIDTSSQEVMDIGARRSLADFLTLANEPHAQVLAGALVQYHLWTQRGEMGQTYGLAYPTTPQSLALLDANPGIRESIRIGTEVKHGLRGFPPSLAVALHYVFASIDAEDADDFWHRVAVGDVREQSPEWHLRRCVIDTDNSRRANRGPQNRRLLSALAIKAWNAYRRGDEMRRLRWSGGGANPESYPVPA